MKDAGKQWGQTGQDLSLRLTRISGLFHVFDKNMDSMHEDTHTHTQAHLADPWAGSQTTAVKPTLHKARQTTLSGFPVHRKSCSHYTESLRHTTYVP